MRLIFSSTNHMNTDISDDRGYIYYTISTPPAFNKVTTITKYRWTDADMTGEPETLGVIEWHRWSQTMFRFDGRVVPADEMLFKRPFNGGRFFTGPDRKGYKWKLDPCCWLRPAESAFQLARFHKKNLGIMKPAHPPYLDVSDRVVSMLDHIVFTFVYVESLRISQQNRTRAARVMPGAGVMPGAMPGTVAGMTAGAPTC